MDNPFQPDENLLRSIRSRMDVKGTRELLEIYAKRDTQEWIPATFGIVKQVLLERGLSESDLAGLSPQCIKALAPEEEEELDEPEDDLDLEELPENPKDTPSPLSMEQKAYMYQVLVGKDTDDLVEIFKRHDTGSWVPEAFSIIHDVLRERGYSEDELVDLSPTPIMNEDGTFNLTPKKIEKNYLTHPSTPKEMKKAAIWERMNKLETEELLNLYAAHDSDTWTPLTFTVVRDILIARGWPEDEIENLILDTQPEEDTDQEEEENE